MTIPIGYHELNEAVEVWRPTQVDDGQGGTTVTPIQHQTVRAKVSQPTVAEQVEAQKAGATATMIVHMRPDADVRRGDFLHRRNGSQLRVKFTVQPSEPVYLRADCEDLQAEGDVR